MEKWVYLLNKGAWLKDSYINRFVSQCTIGLTPRSIFMKLRPLRNELKLKYIKVGVTFEPVGVA
jgi:hypothetical protein